MLALRPIDLVAIEKQRARPIVPVISASFLTRDATESDEFLSGETQLERASAQRDRQVRAADAPLEAPSIRSDIRVGSFVLAFLVMLCATLIGFVSEVRPLSPDLPDRGYDEALGTQNHSVPSVTIPAKGSDNGAPVAEGSGGFRTTTTAETAVACVAASATPELHPKTIGGDHVY
jgi:hypothetical protein